MGDRAKIEAVRAWMREHEANRFTAFQRRDWRDVAKCSFCGANGHEVEKLVQGGGKVASGHPVIVCAKCVDRCAEIAAEHRTGKS